MGWETQRRYRGCAAVWLTLVLSACVDGSEPDHDSAKEFCATDCKRWGECSGQSEGSIEYCKYYCLNSGWPERIRDDVLTAYARCLDRLSCASFDSSEARDGCFADAFENAKPSTACANFCEAHTAKAFECGYRYGIKDCVKYNCGVVDSMLNTAAECAQQDDCEQWLTCTDAAFSFD